MPNMDDFHAFRSTSGGNHSGGNNGGCGRGVVVAGVILLVCGIAVGANAEAMDSLLGLGLLAYLFIRSLF